MITSNKKPRNCEVFYCLNKWLYLAYIAKNYGCQDFGINLVFSVVPVSLYVNFAPDVS